MPGDALKALAPLGATQVAKSVHILGVRHHGPGSARSVLRALQELKPDLVLIEGPPDADDIIAQAAKEQMSPPVAILVHDVQSPARAVFYPLAEFSPEWQAMRWALSAGKPARFMDLPQSHRMAIDEARATALRMAAAENDPPTVAEQPPAGSEHPPAVAESSPTVADPPEIPEPSPVSPVIDEPAPMETASGDPLGELAKAAGFDDGERWWEHVVEHREHDGLAVFTAIGEAIAELRAADPRPRSHDEPVREAWMRRTIRLALKEGASSIAVVCGAWHVPALDVDAFKKKDDDLTLKDLPKLKTAATWIPWTYDRLTFASGYGAGVESPGWYDHLWRSRENVLERWMTRVAHLLREKEIDCSSAHVIESVRLSQTLATLRRRPLADLSDIADATRSVFLFDGDLPMKLIRRELLVGQRIGEVPDDTPAVPLQQDLQRQQKSLRLKPEAVEKALDLDLRNENDRLRSQLLHRLRLLNVDWGTPAGKPQGKGTFHEIWRLRWEPTFVIRLIEHGALGGTIETAAAGKLQKMAEESTDLPSLTTMLADAMLAELGGAVAALVRQIAAVAAISADVALLMATMPKLAGVLRYGSVRQTDLTLVRQIVDGVAPRVAVGLGGAVASLNDEAAAGFEKLIRSTHEAIKLLEMPPHETEWLDALARVAGQESVHGLIRGRCTRLLLDAGRLDAGDVARRLSLALSRGQDPAQAARWVEGFLLGSGTILIHDRKLLALIDRWVARIPAELFDELAPLLRRTFGAFETAERRQIGQMVAQGAARDRPTTGAATRPLDHDRAALALPLLLTILGVSENP